MNTKTTTLFKIGLPVLILVGGVLVMKTLVARKPHPEATEIKDPGILVETLLVEKKDVRIDIRTTGIVKATETARITPEVQGTVTTVAPGFEAGAFMEKGDLLFKIDATDYRLQLEAAKAALARAEAALLQEESLGKVARTDWALSHPDSEPESPLVYRIPQLKEARANVASARATVLRHERDIARCTIKAPFPLRVVSESVAEGTFLVAGQPVAEVAGTSSADIDATLPARDLKWLAVPGPGEKGRGTAIIRIPSMPEVSREGVLFRILGSVDDLGRMLRVRVRLDDPFALKSGAPPVHDGAFASIRIQGTVAEDVTPIPSSALRENDTVWLVAEDGTLDIRKVDVLRLGKETALIRDHLPEGAPLVTSTLSGAAQGMKLRIMEGNPS